MEALYNIDFFVRNDYEKIISKHLLEINMSNSFQVKKWIMDVFEIKDVFIVLYLLVKINPECEYVDDEIINKFGELIKRYSDTIKYHIVDINKIGKHVLSRKISNKITIDVFCSNLYILDHDKEDIEYFRKIFGYSQTFKYFKNLINTIFTEKHDYRQIGLTLSLLNNTSLAFNTLHPIFERSTKYVQENIIDANITCCSEVLKAIVAYNPEVFSDKPDYIPSITSFFIEIFKNPSNFKFISFSDADKIVSGIRIFALSTKQGPKMKNISQGIFSKTYDSLKSFVDRSTSVYEEFICITYLLEIIDIFLQISFDLGSRMHIFEEMFEYVQELSFIAPKTIPAKEYNAVHSKFISHKYRLLDYMSSKIDNLSFKANIFISDLESTKGPTKIINHINYLAKYISWDDLIANAVKPKHSGDYLIFIFKDEFFENQEIDHYHYIEIYIDALCRDKEENILLFAITILMEKLKNNSLKNSHNEILLKLYFLNIDDDVDQRLVKRRKMILDFIYYDMDKNRVEALVIKFLQKLHDNRMEHYNLNIVLFLLISSRKAKIISEDTLDQICRYVVKVCCNHYNSNGLDEEFGDCLRLYISTITEILCYHQNLINFYEEDNKENTQTYFKLIIGLMCFIVENQDDEWLCKIKDYLLNFLFTANDNQRRELHILYKNCYKSKSEGKHEESELINLCNSIKERLGRLR